MTLNGVENVLSKHFMQSGSQRNVELRNGVKIRITSQTYLNSD